MVVSTASIERGGAGGARREVRKREREENANAVVLSESGYGFFTRGRSFQLRRRKGRRQQDSLPSKHRARVFARGPPRTPKRCSFSSRPRRGSRSLKSRTRASSRMRRCVRRPAPNAQFSHVFSWRGVAFSPSPQRDGWGSRSRVERGDASTPSAKGARAHCFAR